MQFILPKAGRSRARHFLPIGLLVLLSGCVYRFTLNAQRPPEGIRTIAVEAVYDTSRDVIPHELIWSAVQREVVRTGQLMLTAPEEADALLTLWVTRSIVSPTGTPSREDKAKDPVTTPDNRGNPADFRELRRAGSWTTDEQIGFNVDVEVLDLKSRQVLFKRSYNEATSFKSLRAGSITPIASGYLHYEEALQAKVKLLADQMAQKVVTDFFALNQGTNNLQR